LDNKYNFVLNEKKVEIVDEYQYLGLKLRPSGSMTMAVQELHDKASRAWFGISNVVYTNKRMEVDKIFSLFDSLVTPVALYGCEFWLPLILQKKCFNSKQNLLNFWEDLPCEKINQKCARMTLSVNRKTSRMAVLGELGRYPLFIKALSQCINYKMSLLGPNKPSSLVTCAVREMQTMASSGVDCWLTRVNKVQTLLNISDRFTFKKSSGKITTSTLKSQFDRHWIDNLNMTKTKISQQDQTDHNKLRTYRTFKSSFTREPYIDLIRNRNQKSSLSRFRSGSHFLGVERGRWTRPVTPLEHRTCLYCSPPSTSTSSPSSPPSTSTPSPPPPVLPTATGPVDDEYHFIMKCSRFEVERNLAFDEMSSHVPRFANMPDQQKFVSFMCPTQPKTAKIANKLIKLMFELREKMDQSRNDVNVAMPST
jgi:hypothetical protein